jgi:hypothetical protein
MLVGKNAYTGAETAGSGVPIQRLIRIFAWATLVLFCIRFPVCGEEAPSNKVRGQRATPETTGPIVTDTTIPQPPGTATLFIPTFKGFRGGNFSPSWGRVSADGNYRSLNSSAQLFVGVAPRTSVYVVVPYQHNWALNVNQPAPNGQKSADFVISTAAIWGRISWARAPTPLPRG